MKSLAQYKNGTATVELLEDGTRKVEWEGELILKTPLQVDLKITNYCDLHNYCQWCHEASDKQGKHADLDKAIKVVSGLSKGAEIAVGGGNPLAHPGLRDFLVQARSFGLIPNLTINELHLKQFKKEIEDLIEHKLIFGLGISWSGKHKNLIKHFSELNPNTVVHIIAGLSKLDALNEVKEVCSKVLVLGYKRFRKGNSFYNDAIEKELQQWYRRLPLYFKDFTLSFDNLAIEQLGIKRYFTQKGWKRFYQGDEGTISFYLDAVEQMYALNSTSPIRFPFEDASIEQMFETIQTKHISQEVEYQSIH